MTETTLLMENFYILDDGRARQFLITGDDEALLIDTGFEDSHVYEAVRKITCYSYKGKWTEFYYDNEV